MIRKKKRHLRPKNMQPLSAALAMLHQSESETEGMSFMERAQYSSQNATKGADPSAAEKCQKEERRAAAKADIRRCP